MSWLIMQLMLGTTKFMQLMENLVVKLEWFVINF
jgi:hypothetical protein